MGDMSELRTLIVIFVTVTATIALVVIMPSEFYTASNEYYGGPDDVDALSLLAWNSTYTLNVTDDNFHYQTINGYNVAVLTVSNEIEMYTYAQWSVFVWDQDGFQWYNRTNVRIDDTFWLSLADIQNYSNPYQFQTKNGKTKMAVTISYNDTSYTSFSDALDNDDLQFTFNLDWEDRNTGLNALSLVAMILTGSLPSVHPVLNGIFAFIGWAFIAAGVYLAFIFTLRLVGAVFGGGGA